MPISRTDRVCGVVMLCWFTIFPLAAIAAPPGSAALDALNLPDTPLPLATPLPDHPEQREAMSRHLQGEQEQAGTPALPVEIMDLMRETGSVLQGSSLDPNLDLLGDRQPNLPPQRWRTAEMLLKTARLLDKLQPVSENQADLVNRMRQQAVRLLGTEVSNLGTSYDHLMTQDSPADEIGFDSKSSPLPAALPQQR